MPTIITTNEQPTSNNQQTISTDQFAAMPITKRQSFKLLWMTLLGIPAIALGSLLRRGSDWRPHSDMAESAGHSISLDAQGAVSEQALTDEALAQRWIVSAREAVLLIEQKATLLDARGGTFITQRLEGAIAVNWQQFSRQEDPHRGRLREDDQQLTEQLQSLGISQDRPIVVFANPPEGWGEDGRIVWMLRTLGHQQAVLVDGGWRSLVEAGVSHQKGKPAARQLGDFVVTRDPTWDIQRDELHNQLEAVNLRLIDTREPREFAGKTPYGERRGGHLPGAINLYFKDLLTLDGRLLDESQLRAKLRDLGITPYDQIVVYCTGGIRSGWLTAVLTTLDFAVQNYAGSMWEWSAAPANLYPLET